MWQVRILDPVNPSEKDIELLEKIRLRIRGVCALKKPKLTPFAAQWPKAGGTRHGTCLAGRFTAAQYRASS